MITAFLPCRLGSQRVPDKNIRDFAGIKGGLLRIKIEQLLKVKEIQQIVVSSNDPRVLEYASQYNSERIIIDERPDHLGTSSTTTDELISYVPSVIKDGHVLWTHVTSPFMNELDYSKISTEYFKSLDDGFDSLMTVLRLQGFIWDKQRPLNYDRKQLRWPMTQTLTPFYEVDSGVFLSSRSNYLSYGDRIGSTPYFYEQDKLKSIDIDWPDDFEIAQHIWRSLNR